MLRHAIGRGSRRSAERGATLSGRSRVAVYEGWKGVEEDDSDDGEEERKSERKSRDEGAAAQWCRRDE